MIGSAPSDTFEYHERSRRQLSYLDAMAVNLLKLSYPIKKISCSTTGNPEGG